jgi:DNA-directed RNA polymerase specialized sigma24 family protein
VSAPVAKPLPEGAKVTLSVVKGLHSRKDYALKEGVNYVGRQGPYAVDVDLTEQENPGAAVAVNRFALIWLDKNGIAIADTGTRLTHLNGERIPSGKKAPLEADDVIRFGKTELKVNVILKKQQLDRLLSCISTFWSAVYQANHGEGEHKASAQRLVLLRYYHPIRNYFRAMVRTDDAAEDLTQEFAVRFLRGDFRQADPSRGRFRDLLKRALRHMAIDYWRRQRTEKERLPTAPVEDWQAIPVEADRRRHALPRPGIDMAEADRIFLEGWRAEMLGEAWQALALFQEETGSPYHTVLSPAD